MESVFAVLQAIGAALAWAWGWIWYGWTSAVDWVTQVGFAQIGITIRETGDIVDYASGMIGIIGAVVAVWHFAFRRRAGTKDQQRAFFAQLNQSVGSLIMHTHSKRIADMEMAYSAILLLIHSHEYLLDKQHTQQLERYWRPAKREYHEALRLARNNPGGKIPTPHLDALQQHVQDVLKKFLI